MATSLKDIYITGLQNAHALEAQAVQLLSRQVERIESYPEMLGRMKQHIEESRVQQQRIDQILQEMGTSASTLKDIATSITGNMAAIAHSVMQDEIMKNTFANFAFEHFEIASYRSLITMAEQAGGQNHISLLRQSLDEEYDMARWLDQNLDMVTRKYMQLEAAGAKSGI